MGGRMRGWMSGWGGWAPGGRGGCGLLGGRLNFFNGWSNGLNVEGFLFDARGRRGLLGGLDGGLNIFNGWSNGLNVESFLLDARGRKKIGIKLSRTFLLALNLKLDLLLLVLVLFLGVGCRRRDTSGGERNQQVLNPRHRGGFSGHGQHLLIHGGAVGGLGWGPFRWRENHEKNVSASKGVSGRGFQDIFLLRIFQ